MASLTVKGLFKNFGKTRALNGVDLEVGDGEFCVLLGPSGCGKSTLLYIIAGLIPQDRGQVLLDGEVIDHRYPRERDMAMVFQNYALYPHMNVAENLGFGLRMRGASKGEIEKMVAEVAELLEIGHLLDRKPRQLSGGQRQRVAMGRALVRRPKLFLLDEPLSNLDARLRDGVRMELKELHQKTRGTMIHVTHDQIEAMTLGDKIVVMKDGKIRQIGSAREVYDNPQDSFVAGFIGSPAMNFLSGEIVHENGTTAFRGQDLFLDLSETGLDPEPGEVCLGVRPEDLILTEGTAYWPKATVRMVSNLGFEQLVSLVWGGTEITARVNKDLLLRDGESVTLRIPAEKLRFFRNGKRMHISV